MATIGTSSNAHGTSFPQNTTVTIAADGTALVIWFDGTNHKYSYASSPYTSWTTATLTSGTRFADGLLLDGADNAAAAANITSGPVTYFPITKSGATYSAGSGTQINATTNTYDSGQPCMFLLDVQGRYWMVSNTNGQATARALYSTTPTTANWTLSLNLTTESCQTTPAADIAGDYLVVCYVNAATSTAYYTRVDVSGAVLGSWSTAAAITHCTGDTTSSYSFRGNGAGKGVLVFNFGGIKAQVYDASANTWSTLTTLDSSTSSRNATLVKVGSDIYCFWCHYVGASNYSLVYKKWTAATATWDANATTLIASGTNINYPQAIYGNSTIGVAYTVGTSNPWTVSFATVPLATQVIKDTTSRFHLALLRDTMTRFRQMSADQLKDATSRLRLGLLRDITSRFRLMSADKLKNATSRFYLSIQQIQDTASRFRQMSANQRKDATSRFRLMSADRLKDATSRFRLMSADQLRDLIARFSVALTQDLPARFSLAAFLDTSARLRLMSAQVLQDTASRLLLMSANQLKDMTSRFKQRSANQLQDVVARLAIMSADLLRDIGSRIALMSADQLDDMAARFSLASVIQRVYDTATRLILEEAQEVLQDIVSRLRLISANRLKDMTSRFKQRSAPQLQDIVARLAIISADLLRDVSSRLALMSAAQVLDAIGRLRLISATLLTDIASRLRLALTKNITAHFQLAIFRDVVTRLYFMSAAQLQDIVGRLALMSADMLHDVGSRFALMSVAQLQDIRSRLRLQSANRLRNIVSRFVLTQAAERTKDISALFGLALVQQSTKSIAARLHLAVTTLADITSQFLLMSADQVEDMASRFRLRSVAQVQNVASRLRLMSANKYKHIVSRLRLMSANQLEDMASRFLLRSVAQLQDTASRLALMSAAYLGDVTARFMVISANQQGDVAARFLLVVANQQDGVTARFSLALPPIIPLTLYGSTVPSIIIATSGTLPHSIDPNLSIGDVHMQTSTTTLNGTASGYGELTAFGSTAPWFSLPAPLGPAGRGWFYDSAYLDKREIVAGDWFPVIALSSSDDTIMADILVRVYLYDMTYQVYTQVVSSIAYNQEIPPSFTFFELPPSPAPLIYYAPGQRLYVNLWLNITSPGTTPTNTIAVYQSSTTIGMVGRMQIGTPGSRLGGAIGVKDTATRFSLIPYPSTAKDASSRFVLGPTVFTNATIDMRQGTATIYIREGTTSIDVRLN